MQRDQKEITIIDIETTYFNAIFDNDKKKLREVINNVDISLTKNGTNGLELAGILGHWECVEIIANYFDSVPTNKQEKFSAKAGRILLKAARNNQLEVVEALCSNLSSAIFYQPTNKFFPVKKLWLDYDKGNTFLHWALKNDNDKMLEILLKKFLSYKIDSVAGYWSFSRSRKLLYTTNNDNQTALELAISLNHLTCAKYLAKFSDVHQVIKNADIPTIYWLAKNDIRFSCYKNVIKNNIPITIALIPYINNKARELILNHILTLPAAEKKFALEKALDRETPLGFIFSPHYFKKIINTELKKLNLKIIREKKKKIITEDQFIKKESIVPTKTNEKEFKKNNTLFIEPLQLNRHSLFSEFFDSSSEEKVKSHFSYTKRT